MCRGATLVEFLLKFECLGLRRVLDGRRSTVADDVFALLSFRKETLLSGEHDPMAVPQRLGRTGRR